MALMAVMRSDSISPALPGMSAALLLSPAETGLVFSLFVLPGVFLSPFLGILADRWGRRRILIISLLLFGLAGPACALARSVETLLALRLLQGIGAAALSSFNIILVADLFQGEIRAQMMGYNATMRVIGSILYPLAGGLLAVAGWRMPFLMPILALPVALFIGRALRDIRLERSTGLRNYFGGMSKQLFNPASSAVFLAGLVVIIAMFGAYFTYLPFLLSEQFGFSPAGLGMIMASRSVIAALLATQFARFNRAMGMAGMIKAAYILYILSFALTPLAHDNLGLAGVTLLIGLAEGLYWPANHLAIGSLASDQNRAGFITINDSVLKIGQFAGPLVMSAAYSRWTVSGPFTLAAALLVTSLAIISFLFYRDSSSRLIPAQHRLS